MDEERKSYREFTVTPGMVGFKVKIGCSEAYFGNATDLKNALSEYLDDPIAATKKYQNNQVLAALEQTRMEPEQLSARLYNESANMAQGQAIRQGRG